MAGQYDRVRRLVRAAGECERFTIHALSQSPIQQARFPGIADCFARELECAEAQIARLQGFLGVDAFHPEDTAPALPGSPDQADPDAVSPADMLDPLAAVYACQRLQLLIYRSLLAAADEIGDNELANLCKEALWVKDAQAARLALEIANLDVTRMPADPQPSAQEPEAESPIAEQRGVAEIHHPGVEIHHDGRGHAEVSIQVEVGPGHAQSAHAVYAQAWSALAEAMAETRHRDEPAAIPARPTRAVKPPRRASSESRAW